jgi:cytidylate kinase
MKIDLKQYFTERDKIVDEMKQPGPVVTVSREYGCQAISLVQRIINQINKRESGNGKPVKIWQWIDREILEESAKNLKEHPHVIEKVFTPEQKSGLRSLLESFVEPDLPYGKINKEIKNILYEYAMKGHVIILGRGGVVISKDIDRSLHIRLTAPLDWRVDHIRATKRLSKLAALKLVNEQDAKRKLFISRLAKKEFDLGMFDLVLNRKTLSEEEIAKIVIRTMEIRGLI